MKRWETLAALAAVILASLGALPLAGRLWFTVAGVLLVVAVGASRLAASLRGGGARPRSDAAERAERIRALRRRR